VLYTAVRRPWTKSVHGHGTGSCTDSRVHDRVHGPYTVDTAPRPPPCTDRAHGGVQGPYLGLRLCTRAAYMCTAGTGPGTGRVPGKIRPRVHGNVETRAVSTGRVRAVCTVLYTIVLLVCMAVHTVPLHGRVRTVSTGTCHCVGLHGRVEGPCTAVYAVVYTRTLNVHGRGHGPAHRRSGHSSRTLIAEC